MRTTPRLDRRVSNLLMQHIEFKRRELGDPSIIPISVHGVVDVDGLQISEKQLMGHALMNSITQKGGLDHLTDVTERYAYRRGSRLVNEYARTRDDGAPFEGDPESPNHLLGSFPTLFPYGKGGFETGRPIKVSYERHIKWAMTYHDKRYSFFLFFDSERTPLMIFCSAFDSMSSSLSKFLAFFKSDKYVVPYRWKSKNPPSFSTQI